MKKLILFSLMLTTTQAFAMNTSSGQIIKRIWSWGEYAEGVILIQLVNTNSECPNGYWFKDSAGSGSKNLLSIALSAYHAKAPITMYANENSDWGGLASVECEVQLIVLG